MSKSAKESKRRRVPYADLVALFFLYEGERHSGYSLKRLLKATRLGEWLPVSGMTVYQSLKRLEERGLVAGEAEAGDTYPDRVVYTITDAGKAFFEENQLNEFATFERDRFHLDIGVGLSSYMAVDERELAARMRMQQLSERLQAVTEELEAYDSSFHSPFPRWLLLDHERALLSAELAWIERCLELLSEESAE